MATIKINGRAITNHWMLLQNDEGDIFERIDIAPSYPSPNWYFNGGLDFPSDTTIPTFELPDGVYHINPQGGSNFTFSIESGLVNYPSDCEPFLSGRGTNKLILNGFDITIDARYLIGNGLVFNGVLGYGGGDPKGNGDQLVIYRTCTLLPGINYYFVAGSGLYADFKFTVEKDGSLTVDPIYNKFTKKIGTDTLIIEGFPIIIDARSNGSDPLMFETGIYNIWDAPLDDNHRTFSTSKVIMGNFLPTLKPHGYYPLNAPNSASNVSDEGFRVDIDGTVEVSDLSYLEVDNFNGMSRVTVLSTLPERAGA